MEPEDRFLEALQAASAGAARLDLDGLQRAFSRAFPHWDGSPIRRIRLRELLDGLAGRARNAIRLPSARQKAAWQHHPQPALPLRVFLVRRAIPPTQRFDHQSFPWVPELAFVAGLPALHNADEVLRLHDFFKNGGSRRPLVPTKERSWQIFGEEKRLDALQRGHQLFGAGRLTLESLRCRNVTQILAFCRCPFPASGPALIVENESTFHSFCRLNHQVRRYAGVVFGDGNTVLRAADFLQDLAQAIGHATFFYFGDLDARGLQIPASLRQMLKERGSTVQPEAELYRALIFTESAAALAPLNVVARDLCWLPTALREPTRIKLATTGRIAQEALGWEHLCVLHGVDPNANFSLGFSPPPTHSKP